MKTAVLISSVVLLLPLTCVQAQRPGGGGGRGLANALKLYPEADTNKDGTLTMAEALAFVNAHPEVKAKLLELRPTRSRSTGPGVSQPGTRSTPASKGLPPGPRVFVCAHSFMIFTGTQLPSVAEAAGIAYQDAGTQMIGGSPTIKHWQVPDEQNLAKKVLREGAVDVLLVSPHVILPDEGIDNFTKLGLEKNPGLRVLVQASWPTRDGNLSGFKNEDRNAATATSLREQRAGYEAAWLRPLEAQVEAINAEVGKRAVFIVPAGKAVFALRERVAAGTAPGLTEQTDLFRDDLGHPQPPLAALVTYCHFAAIYGRSPVGLPVPAILEAAPGAEALNRVLQEIAWEAVSTYPLSGVGGASGEPATDATDGEAGPKPLAEKEPEPAKG